MIYESFNMSGSKIILASASPRRVELLKQMGIDCHVCPVDINESVATDETAKAYVIRLARQKADACVMRLSPPLSHLPILAADTTVVYGGKIYGKPADQAQAIEVLNIFSGRIHHVHTAVSLAYNGTIETVLSTTAVEMMTLSTEQIDQYIATGEYQGKAGSYGIQGVAATWIKRIDGSYSGVMGLPIYETAMLFRQIGFLK